MILDEIIAHKKLEVDTQKKNTPLDEIKRNLTDVDPVRGFKKAISAPGKVNLIAEIKKASPSRGLIRSDFDPEAIAGIYEDNGAAAISVLTDRKFFQGDLSFLERIRPVTSSVPILRKDFIIDEYQIYQSRLAGADAILLIAAALDLPPRRPMMNRLVSKPLWGNDGRGRPVHSWIRSVWRRGVLSP